MTFTALDMNELVDEFAKRSIDLLRSKAIDYAPGADRLQNFRDVAAATGLTPEQVCFVYMHKHLNSLQSMTTSGKYTWDWLKPDGSEGAKQRIADAINYLFLLAAIMEDRKK